MPEKIGPPEPEVCTDDESQVKKNKDKAEDLRYGFCSWKPVCLQVFNTSGAYITWMFISNVVNSMVVNGLAGVILSSLETRFQMSSSQSSWIASAYEIGAVPSMIAVSFFGHRWHRPRVSGIGLMVMAVSCLLFTVPHFTTAVYMPRLESLDNGACLVEDSNATISRQCIEADESGELSWYLYVFVTARFLQGLGGVPMQTIGVTFLDDIVDKQKFALYVAIYFAGGVLGPAIGYIVGGYMLELYTDFMSVNAAAEGLTSSDPQWVGAWWIGFLVGGIVLFFVTIPFFGYCNDLPGAAEIRSQRETEAHGVKEDEDEVDGNLGSISAAEIWRMTKATMLNPCFVFLTIFCVTDAFIITGFSNFGPMYLERQFSISSSLAGSIFGIIAIPGGVGGALASGIIIKRFSLKVSQILKMEILFTIIIIVSGLCFFITCDPIDFAGVNKNYQNSSLDTITLDASCNTNCNCQNVSYNPVCGIDNVLYFSPCLAGCSNYDNYDQDFGNCSCISTNLSLETMASRTNCVVETCTLMPLFIILFFIGMFLLFLNASMNCAVTLRIVPKDMRVLALGLQGLATRAIGTVPGPLAFGAAYDASCLLWQKSCSGGTGSCLHYDNKTMSIYVFLVSIGMKIVSMLFIIPAWGLYKPPTPSSVQTDATAHKDKQGETDKKVNSLSGSLTLAPACVIQEEEFGYQQVDVNKDGYSNTRITTNM